MLKALRKQLSEEEEAFGLIKKKYPHLAKMSDEDILLYCECNERTAIVEYVKELKINLLQEKNRDEIICACTDAGGNTKYLYIDRKDAEQTQVLSHREQNIVLKIYACPTSAGWHLAKE